MSLLEKLNTVANIARSTMGGALNTAAEVAAEAAGEAQERFEQLKSTASEVGAELKEVTDAAREALPSGEQVRSAAAETLIMAGKALIDPRQAAGEVAVKAGELLKPKKDAQ